MRKQLDQALRDCLIWEQKPVREIVENSVVTLINQLLSKEEAGYELTERETVMLTLLQDFS